MIQNNEKTNTKAINIIHKLIIMITLSRGDSKLEQLNKITWSVLMLLQLTLMLTSSVN